jgi:hypothetical protein
MDPFLERPSCFPDLHHNLITFMQHVLQPRLPEPYYAATGERIWVEYSRRHIEPDVDILRSNGAGPGQQSVGGGVAVACQTRTPPVIIETAHDPITETFVEIYSQREGLRLVTSIEVLSLSNKTPGNHGRDLYRQKQRELLGKEVHLIEIDLLRGGEHTTAVPLDLAQDRAGLFDYHVCVRPFDQLGTFYVYPIRLQDSLPEIAVPLLPGDPAVPLDLQAVFAQCYETGGYRRRVRYAEDTPTPPLRPEQAEWVRRLLQDKGSSPPAAAS